MPEMTGLLDFQVFKWAQMISEAETTQLLEPPPDVAMYDKPEELIASKRDTRDVIDLSGVQETLVPNKKGRSTIEDAEQRVCRRRTWTHETPQYPRGPPGASDCKDYRADTFVSVGWTTSKKYHFIFICRC